MKCKHCCERLAYCAEVLGCPDTLTLKVGLTPGTTYRLWIEDMFGNVYSGEVITAPDGSVTLDSAALDLPEHLLHPVGAPLYVWITGSDNPDDYVKLNLPVSSCDNPDAGLIGYDSIFITFAAGPGSTVIGS